MNKQHNSIGDALPAEIERCQEVLAVYATIGPAGAYTAIAIRKSLVKASKAVLGGDVVEMMRAYQDLKGYKL